MSYAFVICMGMGVVFIGLICIVLLVSLTGKIVQAIEKNKAAPQDNSNGSIVPAVTGTVPPSIPNRGELVAAVSAALAEELGTVVSGLRILSLKPVGVASVQDRGPLAAAIAAAIAEESGTDPAGIRIVSMKKIN